MHTADISKVTIVKLKAYHLCFVFMPIHIFKDPNATFCVKFRLWCLTFCYAILVCVLLQKLQSASCNCSAVKSFQSKKNPKHRAAGKNQALTHNLYF